MNRCKQRALAQNGNNGFRARGALVLTAWFCLTAATVTAQPRMGLAYCDMDHFHDTVPALFYNDEEYTPAGRLRWNTERYERKVQQAAAVIDSLHMPLVALWSVENETVVRDIVMACEGDYNYLHRTLNSLDGMDFALLYYGDLFEPYYDEPGRRYLYVEGVLRHPARRTRQGNRYKTLPARLDTLGIVLCSDTRMAEWIVRDLRDEHPGVKLVVAGRSSSLDAAAYGLHNALARAESAGRGNVFGRKGWLMRDRILVDSVLRCSASDVYARRFLFDPAVGKPLPTYERKRYRGGMSYALPIFVYFE